MHSPEAVKFLLVDDLRENLLALEALLRQEGLELFTAQSGAEALELLLVHEFSLALLDVQMPDMDGFELAEVMRSTERTRRVPIIFLTAVATDERRRFRGYEAGAVDYLLKPVDPQTLRSKASVFLELGRQRQELARQRDELRHGADLLADALERLKAHHDNSPLAVVEFDRDFRVAEWSKGAERMFGWSAAEVLGRQPGELAWVHEEDAAAFARLCAEMQAGIAPRNVHTCRSRRADGTVADCEWYCSALFDAAGTLASVSAQILEVTERRRAEETQNLLVGELNHRVKNTLATVQAIATQTLRHTANPADFARDFSGRIQAMAHAHSLLSSATWTGADLAELIEDQLRIGAIDEARLTASGPEIVLVPQLALHVALVLHELGTNANKYGALSVAEGHVEVGWSIEDGRLHLTWEERGGPPVKAPTRRGFGTTLIEQGARAEGGAARVAYRVDGVAWHITLPLPPTPHDTPRLSAMPAHAPAKSEAAAAGPHKINGRRLLVIEDEPLVALELVSVLKDAGAEVVGPAGTCEQALRMIETGAFDGALLDGNLHGEPVDEVAAALTRRNVPFVFVSGYGRSNLPPAFSGAAVVAKPFTHHELLEAALKLIPEGDNVVQLRKSPPAVVREEG